MGLSLEQIKPAFLKSEGTTLRHCSMFSSSIFTVEKRVFVSCVGKITSYHQRTLFGLRSSMYAVDYFRK